jgi:hypothetical protein
MSTNIPVTGVVTVSQMIGDDEDETSRLQKMELRARDYLLSFGWCDSIRNLYFGSGVGDVFAVFFAHIQSSHPEVDEYLWIIVGDLPPAYLVADDCPTPRDALICYLELMREWVALAKEGKASENVIPVNVPATPEWAEVLEGRLNTLEKEIIPMWFGDR